MALQEKLAAPSLYAIGALSCVSPLSPFGAAVTERAFPTDEVHPAGDGLAQLYIPKQLRARTLPQSAFGSQLPPRGSSQRIFSE